MDPRALEMILARAQTFMAAEVHQRLKLQSTERSKSKDRIPLVTLLCNTTQQPPEVDHLHTIGTRNT